MLEVNIIASIITNKSLDAAEIAAETEKCAMSSHLGFRQHISEQKQDVIVEILHPILLL